MALFSLYFEIIESMKRRMQFFKNSFPVDDRPTATRLRRAFGAEARGPAGKIAAREAAAGAQPARCPRRRATRASAPPRSAKRQPPRHILGVSHAGKDLPGRDRAGQRRLAARGKRSPAAGARPADTKAERDPGRTQDPARLWVEIRKGKSKVRAGQAPSRKRSHAVCTMAI